MRTVWKDPNPEHIFDRQKKRRPRDGESDQREGFKMGVLWRYMHPYRMRILLALLGTAVITLLGVMPPLFMRYLVDSVIGKKKWEYLLLIALLAVFIPIAAHIIRFFNHRLIILAGRRFIADIRTAAYRKVIFFSMKYHG